MPREHLLADELIDDTVRYAAHGSPFYSGLYGNARVDLRKFRGVRSLARLPIVDKDMLRQAGRQALCASEGAVVNHVQYTSGTTSEPFVIHRSVNEVRFIEKFFTRLAAPSSAKQLIPIMLQTQFADHGMSTQIPAPVFVLPFSVTDERLVDHAIYMLRREFDLPGVESRVSILSGSHTGILALTDYVLEHAIDCRNDFCVRLIHLEGRYLTRRWRSVLENVWSAGLSDKYSMTEVFGGANSCDTCKGFHFDPVVVAELVHPQTRERIDHGVGVLVLTSLFPFVQLQPMIRYWTGDLFEVRPSPCDHVSFYYHGRINHALFGSRDLDTLWLSGVDLIEALDVFPEVSRTKRFRDLDTLRYTQASGELKFTGVAHRGNRRSAIDLLVELTFQPGLYPAQETVLRQEILRRLFEGSHALAEAVSSGRVEIAIRFVRPGSLEPLQRFAQLWNEDDDGSG